MDDRKTFKGLAFGFITGAVVGGIAALLLAPKSGKELRQDIRNKSGDVAHDVEKYLKQAQEKAKNLINEGKDKSSALVADARVRAEALLKDTEQMLANAKQRMSDEGARVKQAVKAGVDAYKEGTPKGDA
jgi:gas vesicle protein